MAKGYQKVISTADGQASLYTIYVDRKKNQMLAELPRGFERQKHFIAMTIATETGAFAPRHVPLGIPRQGRRDRRSGRRRDRHR